MGKIAFVVFSLTLILSIQFVVVQETQDFKPKPGFNVADDHIDNSLREMATSLENLELTPDQANRLKEEIKEAFESGDLDDVQSIKLSPQQQEQFYQSMLVSTFMKMADDGIINSDEVKTKLYPQGEKLWSPEAKSAFDQILQTAKTKAQAKAIAKANANAVNDKN
ncbi:hypothetical protein ES332_A04G038800v1 [Gossypium tomentosum]|uniref:EF-hand domain-containing protein n=1 Tax=Gossypium tomentosum TaxID=34277 RepID=A0A5D2QU39_GOSTO|nr:hypothetical protein ES332_A04G038800v1 [Gossypium tomentosum]